MSDASVDISLAERLVIFEKSVNSLKELVNIQCSDGNWNHDSYMHGMANGMILALSLFQEGSPEYLDAPDVWIEDIPNDEKPISIE